jgi:hypothetical protein
MFLYQSIPVVIVVSCMAKSCTYCTKFWQVWFTTSYGWSSIIFYISFFTLYWASMTHGRFFQEMIKVRNLRWRPVQNCTKTSVKILCKYVKCSKFKNNTMKHPHKYISWILYTVNNKTVIIKKWSKDTITITHNSYI